MVDRCQSCIPIGRRFEIDRLVALDDGSILIEWPSIPGNHYVVEYSGDMKSWLAAGGQPIPAAGNRKQWIDNGPPKLQSHPSEAKTRYYRVVEFAPAN